jgi:hypothetical protein
VAPVSGFVAGLQVAIDAGRGLRRCGGLRHAVWTGGNSEWASYGYTVILLLSLCKNPPKKENKEGCLSCVAGAHTQATGGNCITSRHELRRRKGMDAVREHAVFWKKTLVRAHSDVALVCVWQTGFARAGEGWRWLRSRRCPWETRVKKIVLVRQRVGGVPRLDLFVSPASAATPLGRWLRGECPAWHVKLSQPWGQRAVRRAPRPAVEFQAGAAAGQRLAAATLNVGTLNGKRSMLAQWVRDQDIGLLALQETRLSHDGWPLRIHGCSVFAHAAGDASRGQHGVALVVDRRLLPVVALVTPYSVWVRMDTVLPAPLYVASVYIPNASTGMRKAVQTQVCAEARRFRGMGGEVCLLGDWNQRPLGLLQLLSRQAPGLFLLPVFGSAVSWARGDHASAIDHIVGSLMADNRRFLGPESSVERESPYGHPRTNGDELVYH